MNIQSVVLVLLCCVCLSTRALHSYGSIQSEDNWVFIEKFCFDETGGEVLLRVTDNTNANESLLVLYADAEEAWPTVVDSQKSCSWKLSAANWLKPLHLIAPDTVLKVQSARPRWWYFVVANCVDKIDMRYDITFTNAGDKWTRHFTKDSQGVYQMSIVFFLIQFLLCFALVATWWVCKQRKMHTKVVVAVFTACMLQDLSLLFQMIHYSLFAEDGKGAPGLQSTSICSHLTVICVLTQLIVVDMLSQVVFMGVVFVLVKGYPISTNFVAGKRLVMLILFLFFIAYMAVFIWWEAGRDPAQVLYIYDSSAGYVLIALRIVALMWCLKELVQTYKFENEKFKKVFYMILGWYIALWYLSMPITVLIAHFLASWIREKIVVGIVYSLNTLTFGTLAFLFRPAKGNKYFSILDPKASIEFGSNTLQIFPL